MLIPYLKQKKKRKRDPDPGPCAEGMSDPRHAVLLHM
jgi:hypothetical protein